MRDNLVIMLAWRLILLIPAPALPTADQSAYSKGPSRVVTLRVGFGCTFTSIQSVIDSVAENGSAVIRIRDAVFEENPVISKRNIELIGGHASCSDNSPTGTTAIRETTVGSPTISASSVRSSGDPDSIIDVFLVNLDLQNGSVGSLHIGGQFVMAGRHCSAGTAGTLRSLRARGLRATDRAVFGSFRVAISKRGVQGFTVPGSIILPHLLRVHLGSSQA